MRKFNTWGLVFSARLKMKQSSDFAFTRAYANSAIIVVVIAAAVMIVAMHAAPAKAAEQYPSGPEYRGVIQIDSYVIFPENRSGNAVYLEDKMIYSREGETILDVLPLPVEGRFIYLARDANEDMTLRVFTTSYDGKIQVKKVAEGVFHAKMDLDGVPYKKMYRLIDNKILDLLPTSKTADGPVAGASGVVFFHVASASDSEDEEGKLKQVFGLRVHLTQGEAVRLRSLDFVVKNALPRLKIEWVDAETVAYTLDNGKREVLTLSQFQ